MRSRINELSIKSGLIMAALFFFAGPVSASACESEQAKKLSFLEGEWLVESRFRSGGEPERWETSRAHSKIEAVFPGCLWREEFTGSRGGRELKVTGLFAFSNISNRLQHVWAHSQHGLLTFYEGVAEGGSIEFESGFSLRGTRVLVRKVFTRKDSGFEVRTERSLDEGRTWDVNWILVYGPSKASASPEAPESSRLNLEISSRIR